MLSTALRVIWRRVPSLICFDSASPLTPPLTSRFDYLPPLLPLPPRVPTRHPRACGRSRHHQLTPRASSLQHCAPASAIKSDRPSRITNSSTNQVTTAVTPAAVAAAALFLPIPIRSLSRDAWSILVYHLSTSTSLSTRAPTADSPTSPLTPSSYYTLNCSFRW